VETAQEAKSKKGEHARGRQRRREAMQEENHPMKLILPPGSSTNGLAAQEISVREKKSISARPFTGEGEGNRRKRCPNLNLYKGCGGNPFLR